MIKNLNRLFLLVNPVLLCSAVAVVCPAQAATLSTSQSQVELFNFNLEPNSINLTTNANASAVAGEGSVAIALPVANTNVTLPLSLTGLYSSTAQGEGLDYDATAQTRVRFVGQFLVQSVFSFDFLAGLNLNTAIDDPGSETANSFANVSFLLFEGATPNRTNLLDAFSLAGNLDTPGNGDFLKQGFSSNFSLTPSNFSTSFGGQAESAQAFVEGSYKRSFSTPTYVTLIEQTVNRANTAAVPEPTTMLGMLMTGGMGMVLKLRRKSRGAN